MLKLLKGAQMLQRTGKLRGTSHTAGEQEMETASKKAAAGPGKAGSSVTDALAT